MILYTRFRKDDRIGFAQLKDKTLCVLDGDYMQGDAELTGEMIALEEVELLAPVVPPNIICIGLNYKPHAAEAEMKLPDIPLIFIKSTNALANPGDAIVLPRIAPDCVDYEGELAIVIGRTAKNVSEEDALDYVFGYTIANDVSARDCQLHIDSQWARGKSFISSVAFHRHQCVVWAHT